MKHAKRIFSLIIAILLMLQIPLCSDAALAPLKIGDVDRDYEVTVIDATVIQKCLASLKELDTLSRYLGDVDGEDGMNIIDATLIQKKLALFDVTFYEEYVYDYYIQDTKFNCDFCRENEVLSDDKERVSTAFVGVPVHFEGSLVYSRKPWTYEFFVNDEVVKERSEDNALTYTFEKTGRYTVKMVMYNAFDAHVERRITFIVKEPSDKETPYIAGVDLPGSAWFVAPEGNMNVNAIFGDGDYEYRYEVTPSSPIPTKQWKDGYGFQPFKMMDTTSEKYVASIMKDYSSDSSLDIGKVAELLGPVGYFTQFKITVTVRDKTGKRSEPVTVDFCTYELVG